jgi:hypothetical protein
MDLTFSRAAVLASHRRGQRSLDGTYSAEDGCPRSGSRRPAGICWRHAHSTKTLIEMIGTDAACPEPGDIYIVIPISAART